MANITDCEPGNISTHKNFMGIYQVTAKHPLSGNLVTDVAGANDPCLWKLLMEVGWV